MVLRFPRLDLHYYFNCSHHTTIFGWSHDGVSCTQRIRYHADFMFGCSCCRTHGWYSLNVMDTCLVAHLQDVIDASNLEDHVCLMVTITSSQTLSICWTLIMSVQNVLISLIPLLSMPFGVLYTESLRFYSTDATTEFKKVLRVNLIIISLLFGIYSLDHLRRAQISMRRLRTKSWKKTLHTTFRLLHGNPLHLEISSQLIVSRRLVFFFIRAICVGNIPLQFIQETVRATQSHGGTIISAQAGLDDLSNDVDCIQLGPLCTWRICIIP